ncbi:MAG TPA: DNA topoisomerase IB [Solirubrobacterales bacterium]|nr:DNA topoisomerase IB [Solirubrobacterales bacterium]
MARLRRVDCSEPGIHRIRRGRGFSYEDEDGRAVRDPETLERIAELVIPPAWTDVWICANPRGHIQATGYDAAGRKQYLYHSAWRENRDREKFAEMEAFARALPGMRKRTDADLALRGLVRNRVLACSVRLLDLGFFRIGSERYAEDNGTFGLATLRRSHVRIERGVAVFDYYAKGAKRHRQEIADPAIVPTIKALKNHKAPGKELLGYRNGKAWVDVRSAHINEYLKDVMGADYSAKDFRTWNATVLAAVELATNWADADTKTARKRGATAACKRVSGYLSNTPAVCRSSYIDPRVFDRFDSGETIHATLKRIVAGSEPGEFPDRERIERAVLRLLKS